MEEIINYKVAILIRKFFFLSNEYILDTPSNLGKKFKIPVSRFVGSINDEINLQRIKQLEPELIIAIRYAEILKKNSSLCSQQWNNQYSSISFAQVWWINTSIPCNESW